MGLEPTTFCMASGSLGRVSDGPKAVPLSRIARIRGVSDRSSDSRDFRSIRLSLGTGSALVPKRSWKAQAAAWHP
jgi:hypothetical protein